MEDKQFKAPPRIHKDEATGITKTEVDLSEGVGCLIFTHNPKVFPHDVIVHLRLDVERSRRPRELGVIRLRERVFCCERRLSDHLMRVSSSIAFCYQLIVQATRFDYVEVAIDQRRYFIPRWVLIKHGKQDVKFHKSQGFEIQLNCPLSLIEQYPKPKPGQPLPPLAEPIKPEPVPQPKQAELFA